MNRILIDLHQDFLDPIGKQTSADQLRAADVRLILAAIFLTPEQVKTTPAHGLPRQIDEAITQYQQLALHENLPILTTMQRLPNESGLLLHLEGLDGLPDGDSASLERWIQRGLRSVGLTWNTSNAVATGSGTNSIDGLSDFGKDVVDLLEERGVLIDLAHINIAGFNDVAERTQRPLFVSHSAAAALCSLPRNLTDTQLRQVGDSGGVIGVFASQRFLSEQPSVTIDAVADHIEHIRNVAGSGAVALGTDFGGITSGTPKGFTRVADLPFLLKLLQKRGWTSDDLDRLAFKNAMRILTTIES